MHPELKDEHKIPLLVSTGTEKLLQTVKERGEVGEQTQADQGKLLIVDEHLAKLNLQELCEKAKKTCLQLKDTCKAEGYGEI